MTPRVIPRHRHLATGADGWFTVWTHGKHGTGPSGLDPRPNIRYINLLFV